MDWLPLESKMFRSVAYDADNSILYLRFRSGDVYRYFEFDRERYNDLLRADPWSLLSLRHPAPVPFRTPRQAPRRLIKSRRCPPDAYSKTAEALCFSPLIATSRRDGDTLHAPTELLLFWEVRAEVRSFDLFDTLVARRCGGPSQIFEAIEAKAGVPGLAKIRAEVERTLIPPFTLTEIYEHVSRRLGLAHDSPQALCELELAIEWTNLVPIRQHCADVRPGDLVISDMYLPADFLRKVIIHICGLPFNTLFVSINGKQTGTVWQDLAPHFCIKSHLGDNSLSDLAVPQNHGIPAKITSTSQPTRREMLLAANGMAPLARVLREARLRTWDEDPLRRQSQLIQIQGNFPLLFVASLYLAQMADVHGWEVVLFSSRDCYLWSRLYSVLADQLNLRPRTKYFFTSRLAKSRPSEMYIRYFDDVRGGRRSVVVDICGTGWSTGRLIQSAPYPETEQFVIHHIRGAEIEKQYQQLGKVSYRSPLHSLITHGDNRIPEVLNFAAHPMVLDVVAVGMEFAPVFSTLRHDPRVAAVIELHHDAFMSATELICNLNRNELSGMIEAVSIRLVQELYSSLPKEGGGIPELVRHQALEEDQIWPLLKQKTGG